MASDTLPTTGHGGGTYTWSASYSGRWQQQGRQRGRAGDQRRADGGQPRPARRCVTTASPAVTLRRPVGTPTLSDSAELSGGYLPDRQHHLHAERAGRLLVQPERPVNGQRRPTRPATRCRPTGTAAGTYTWSVSYTGDSQQLRSPANQGGASTASRRWSARPARRASRRPARPSRWATTAPTLSGLGRAVGRLLSRPATSSSRSSWGRTAVYYGQTTTVSGNGTYHGTTGYTLPTTGTVAGTYTWTASYTRRRQQQRRQRPGRRAAEQTVVSAASPTMVTTASPATSRWTPRGRRP